MENNNYMQVKEFSEFRTSNEYYVNEFLKKMSSRIISVTPLANNKMGGVMYVVVYVNYEQNQ